MKPPETIGELEAAKKYLADMLLHAVHEFETTTGMAVSEITPAHQLRDSNVIETTSIIVEIRRANIHESRSGETGN